MYNKNHNHTINNTQKVTNIKLSWRTFKISITDPSIHLLSSRRPPNIRSTSAIMFPWAINLCAATFAHRFSLFCTQTCNDGGFRSNCLVNFKLIDPPLLH